MLEQLTVEIILILVGAGFLAAFIDSVVGGGGMISLPALLMLGIDPVVALGTNKLASTTASLTSTISFLRSGIIEINVVKYLFPLSLVGSVLGVLLVQVMPPDILRPIVVVMLAAVTIYSIIRKEWGTVSTYTGMTKKMMIAGMMVALFFGAYDGFFGPGTGSFLLFAFLFLGCDFVRAAGNAKSLNFASNLAALAAFMYFGSIDYLYGGIMAASMIVGAICGTRVAITKGASYVKPLFIVVSTLMVGKQVWELFFK